MCPWTCSKSHLRFVEGPRELGLVANDVCPKVVGKELAPTCPLPANSIHVSVKMSLACPLEQDIVPRLRTFLSSTFWRNAMECVFAAAAFALHSCSVDRASWSSGPGGVEQSLMSHLIDATFGDMHRWLGMSVFYSDDEMRKQADLLVGALVVTGEESPETERPMRADSARARLRVVLPAPC